MERIFTKSLRSDVKEELIAYRLAEWIAEAMEEGYVPKIERDIVKGVIVIELVEK